MNYSSIIYFLALELLTSEAKDKDYESILSYLQVLGLH